MGDGASSSCNYINRVDLRDPTHLVLPPPIQAPNLPNSNNEPAVMFHGGIYSPSVLQCLHDALSLKGPSHIVYNLISINLADSWILACPLSTLPKGC